MNDMKVLTKEDIQLVSNEFQAILTVLRSTPRSRSIAIVITELEKAYAYWQIYAVPEEEKKQDATVSA
jgi:phytoene/squalene synthetase